LKLQKKKEVEEVKSGGSRTAVAVFSIIKFVIIEVITIKGF
jgi:hypothetical protein